MKRGAFDFIVKPWDNEKLIATLTAARDKARKSMGGDPETGPEGVPLDMAKGLEGRSEGSPHAYPCRRIRPSDPAYDPDRGRPPKYGKIR